MNDQLVDLKSIEAFSGGNRELMKIHIATFLDFAPAQLEEIKSKLDEKNWQEVRNLAHKLKPKLRYMGITSVVPLVESIESSAETLQDLEQLPDKIAEMDALVRQAITELKNFVDR